MAMELDKVTGVPVLPEEHFWRVVDLTKRGSTHDGELEVQLIERQSYTQDERVWHATPRTWRSLWLDDGYWGVGSVGYRKEVVLHAKSLAEYKKDAKDYHVREGFYTGWKKSKRFMDGHYTDDGDWCYTIVRLQEPTEENVLQAMKELFVEFEKSQEDRKTAELEEERRAKLVGDYPPKVLGANLISGVVRIEGDRVE